MSDAFILKVDENDWTIGDLEDFETVAEVSLIDALKPVPVLDIDGNKVFDDKGRPETAVNVSPKVLKALVWVTKRREVHGFTVEDARNVKIKSLVVNLAGEGESDPKEDALSV